MKRLQESVQIVVVNMTRTYFFKQQIKKYKQQRKKTKKKVQKVTSRKQLANVRVIQRNLVYVVGLTLNVAKEEFLRKNDNFSKFGKITKIVINKSNLHSNKTESTTRTPTVSAYITYHRHEDAQRAIQAVDGTWLDGKLLRASFGTTKYCSYFLKGVECANPDCMYLHDYGNDDDTFNKEDIILKNGLPIPYNSGKFEEYYPTKHNVEKHVWNYFSNSQKEEDFGDEEEEEEETEEEDTEEEEEEEEEEEIQSPTHVDKRRNIQSIQTQIPVKETKNINVKKKNLYFHQQHNGVKDLEKTLNQFHYNHHLKKRHL